MIQYMTHTMNMTYGFKKQISRLIAAPKLLHEYAYILLTGERSFCEAPSFSPSRRTASPTPTDCQSAPYGLRVLRYAAILILMMVLGVNSVWCQVGKDFSGTYYIANHNRKGSTGYDGYSSDINKNFYLCPSTIMYDEDQPFLTTNKERSTTTPQNTNAKWTIKFAKTEGNVDYYYLIHSSDKYLTWHDPMEIGDKGNATDRVRLHLQSTLNEDKALFYFTEGTLGENDYNICLKDENCSKGTPGSLNPAKDNVNDYEGIKSNWTNVGSFTDPIDGTTKRWCGGLIGIFEQNDPTGVWYLEDYITRPTISYNLENKILITPAQTGEGIIIKYTTDGKTPTSEYGETYSEPFDPPANTVMIKAIAIVNDEESNVATFTPPVFLGYTHKYLIQSQGNGWTTGSFQGNHYYMIPGDDDNNITKVNTTSMLRPSMQWYFLNAGDNYYYIVNNVDDTRMRYNTTNVVHMDTWDDSNADEFKFQIVESATAGTYNIIPYGVTVNNKYLNKASGNTSENALILNNSATDANSRWKFVPQDTPLADTPPFTTSDANTSVYYKIQNGNGNSHFIIPPTTTNYATASNATDDATVKKMSWYFEKVKDPTDEDWLTYYKVVNAETGKALHYTEIANTSLNVGSYDDGDDNYKFAFVKSPTTNYYYIVPKSVKDDKLSQISMIYRDNNALKKGVTRGNNGNIWTFTLADLFCNDPVFDVEEGVIKIKCNTNAAKIYINTESDTDPTDGSTLYNPTQVTAQNWETNNQVRIKAIAIVNDGTNSASSAVITLLNKPDVTLAGGPYTYKGTAWEPSVTSVSIGETVAPTSPATYTVAYSSNNTDAGIANVTITDNEASDAWYIWNVPVTEFTIDKAPLTIKANDKTIGYGDEPDNDGVTYNGFVGDPAETESVLGGTLSYSYTTSGDDPQPYTPFDAQYGNQGSYVITPSGLTSTNYDITFSTGVLTVAKKSIGDGALAEGFTLSFDEDGNVILNFGTHTLNKDVDYTIGNEVVGTKYSTRTLSGAGNYDGSVVIRNAIVHFTTDANQTEWSATFVAESSGGTDIGHALPEDIAAYIISDIEGTWAIPEPLEYIPAGVPVLLVTHEAKNGFLVKDANNVTAISEGQIAYNKLKKVTTESAHFNTRQIYVLYNNEFVLNKEGNLENGKVYMDNPQYVAPSPSPAPANLRIAWGNSTGIETVHSEGLTVNDQSDRWYTLDGRCLSGKPTTKGLYIVNGKKIVIK